MEVSPDRPFNVVEQRIQTLTSILQKMDRRFSPTTSDRSHVPAFLRHFVTLLTCGSNDPDARRVIAVTGSLTSEDLRTLVVTQNPLGSSGISEYGVKEISRSSGTFEEVVQKAKNFTLPEHISDVWAAIASYDPNNAGHFRSFCLFIVARCFRKVSKLIFQDRGCWGVSVRQKLYGWIPLSEELDNVRWIDRPEWAFTAPGMQEQVIEKSSQHITQWKLSTATLPSWAWLLATMIKELELAVEATKDAQVRKDTVEETKEMENVHRWCHRLYAYVHWKEGVVKTLLTKTSLAHSFHLGLGLNIGADAEPDELAEMRREPAESEGQQVLRYLHAIVAWHAAAENLLDGKSHHVAQTLIVGLVQVPPTSPDLMTNEEVTQEFFNRYPNSSPEVRNTIEDIIRENHTQAKFTGTTHAEATLMGLLTYFSPGSHFVNHGVLVKEDNLRFLKELVEPATFEKAIAVGKKCCWCCDRLGGRLGDIKLPGSHGVLYSWTPPRVGVDITVLRALEGDLWKELKVAVGDTMSRVHSRQSSGSSTVGGGERVFDPLVFKDERIDDF